MMQRISDKSEIAHVFFTTEGYDDFRKTVPAEKEEKFDFVSGLSKTEYDTKLDEWEIFNSLPNDRELMEYISEM